MQKDKAMVSHQGKTMTKARPSLQKKPSSPKKSEDRLAAALRENLHRRKAQARSRAAGVAEVGADDLPRSPQTDALNKVTGDSSNG